MARACLLLVWEPDLIPREEVKRCCAIEGKGLAGQTRPAAGSCRLHGCARLHEWMACVGIEQVSKLSRHF